MTALAEEMREALFNRLTKIGGHFGPNFGMVEATIALHYVFNSPVDKFVFDVSHQSYAHKLLTGRKAGYLDDEHFAEDSGYTNPDESGHDFFNVGHTSTSIALAAGLAEEMREALFNRLTKIGGHFGPNFGMVEATIALHYVFNSPVDKFVFDVSHQSYAHKLLTGRKAGYLDDEHFAEDSGYTNPDESGHDFFNVGHTSTSIALAAGLAKGRDVLGGNENIICEARIARPLRQLSLRNERSGSAQKMEKLCTWKKSIHRLT